jgi:hypothetical protein
MSRLSKLAPGIAAVALVLGVYALVDAFPGWVFDALTVAVLAAVLLSLAIVLWPRLWQRPASYVAPVFGAAVVAFLALAGVNVITNLIVDAIDQGSLPIWVGLILAVAVFWAAAFWYLRARRSWSRKAATLTSGLLAVFVILVVPLLVGLQKADRSPVPKPKSIAPQLDIALVSDGSRHPAPPQLPASPLLEEFDLTYSVGFAAGEEVRWTLVGSDSEAEALAAVARGDEAPALSAPPPQLEVLLLLVDGTAPVNAGPEELSDKRGRRGEVVRWKRVARNATDRGVPAFALLQTEDRRRLRSWESFGSPGRAVSAQGFGGRTVAEAAVRLAISSPTEQADLALALEYRPILLFDRREKVPWPVSIDAMFKAGAFTLCRDEGVAETDCGDEPLRRPAELENGGTHLQLDLEELGNLRGRALEALQGHEEEASPLTPAGAGSAIYVHPYSITRNKRELLYLDYWWYLPDNPVEVGGGTLCGAGFVIPGVTCLSHQSDWEGMTVVVRRKGIASEIVAVQYAQHDDIVRYDWGQLRAYWDNLPDGRVKEQLARIPDASKRPIAFIANGTHATYPTPCEACRQKQGLSFGEDPRRGDFGWVGNETGACVAAGCLQMLPTRAGGEEPALWNAFEGPWGKRNCFLTYYCDSSSPPPAPGSQGRYQDPTRYDERAELKASPSGAAARSPSSRP